MNICRFTKVKVFFSVAFRSLFLFSFLFSLLPNILLAQSANEHKDITYASVDGIDLKLDIYLPDNVSQPPLFVYLHGGAWSFGTKESGVPMQFVENGFAVASVEFRQSGQAKFPAMIHDIKASVRFLRANAADYGFDASNIAISGSSSGAHLAQLVGVSNGDSYLEGNLGGHQSTSSDIQAIISYFGASDLTTILTQSTPFGLNVRGPALERLLGALPEDGPEQAQAASPVFYVDVNDPPLLLLHGVLDPQMPINQSLQMAGAYEEKNLDVYFDAVQGAVHGGPGFFEPAHLERAVEFLDRTIR